MKSFSEDYKFGIEEEVKLKDLLENHFSTTLNKLPKVHKFDYEGKDILIEIKSRHISSTYFDTTIVGMGKIEYAKKSPNKCYFVFNFTDGVYYIEYNEEVFKEFKQNFFKRTPRKGIIDKLELYQFIPIKNLTLINGTIN